MRPCFLISLPRAGSTLLQRLLGQHPEIVTTGEPWLMLPFVYALRRQGCRSEFSHHSMNSGFREFVEGLPEGEATYYREVGEMVTRIQSQRSGKPASYFLDKTPRYHLILNELPRMFPEARFVVLHRNPLAVVASILQTWTNHRFRLKSTELDVYEGPLNIHAFVTRPPAHLLEVRYEELVASPLTVLAELTRFLGLAPLASAALPEKDEVTQAALGDKRGIHRYREVSTASVDAWPRAFASPIRRAWARRYLDYLGEERLQRMGQRRDELQATLRETAFNPRQFLHDLIDFRWRALPLLAAPAVAIQHVGWNKQVRRSYRFRWTSSPRP